MDEAFNVQECMEWKTSKQSAIIWQHVELLVVLVIIYAAF